MKKEKIERKKLSCESAAKLNENRAIEKKTYLAPTVAVFYIEMEEGIAAGSGGTSPSDSNNNVKDSWNTNADRSGGLDW